MQHGVFAIGQVCEAEHESLLATNELAGLDNQPVQRGELSICVLL
jgi:hypothetical protein